MNVFFEVLAGKPKKTLYTLLAVVFIGIVVVGCTFTEPKNEIEKDADAGLTLYDLGKFAAAIPTEYVDQLLVYAGDDLSSNSEVLSLYEKASVEAAIADGYTDADLGWLFSFIRYDRVQYERYLCGDGSGLSFFGHDDGWYYGCAFPTDVRFYRQGENYLAGQTEWDVLLRQVEPAVRADFIARNNLSPYSDDTARAEYTYEGGHQFLNYYPYFSINGSKDEFYVLTLSQPARQGVGGIWCVERMTGRDGHVVLWFPDTGMPAAEYYAQLQDECNAGLKTELLTAEGAAIAFVQESGYFNSPIVEGSLEVVNTKVD